MADIAFNITSSYPLADLPGRHLVAYKAMIERKKEAMNSEGGRLVRILRSNAPRKTGEFADSITHKVFVTQRGAGFNIEMASPLGVFITKGTRPHIIAARNAKALRFHWPKFGGMVMVPKRGGFGTHVSGGVLWIGKGYVNHPGTKPNPFIKKSIATWTPGARQVLNFMAEGYTQAFSD